MPQNLLLLVYDSLAPLAVGLLFQVNEFTIECEGGLSVRIKGNALGLVFPVNEGFTTSLKGALHCSKTVGKPGETRYWNSSGTESSAKLEANFGAGFTSSCEEVAPETISLTASQKIEIMG